MSAARIAKAAEAKAAAFNARVAVGDLVDYYAVTRGEPSRYSVSAPAEVLGGHTAVVWLEGKSGCVAVDACVKVPV